MVSRVEACEKVAEAWNKAAIRYSVVHGLEDYPETLGRDLDVLVDQSQLELAAHIARLVLDSHFDDVVRPPPTWGERLIAVQIGPDTLTALELHLIPEIRWRSVLLASNPQANQSVGPFAVDPWAAFAKRVVLPALAGGGDRFRARPDQLAIHQSEAEPVDVRLSAIASEEIAEALLQAVEDADPDAIDRLLPALRRLSTRRAWRSQPFNSLRRVIASARTRFLLPFTPCVPVVALVGPDGVGKSSLLAEIQSGDHLLFNGITIRHWRPGLLPPLSALLGRDDFREPLPHGGFAPRRTPGRFRSLRLVYYAIDYLLGAYLKDYVESSRQRLVLYDRCLLDMAVDPVRYGLKSPSGVKLLWRLLPGPDLVVVLTDQPSVIAKRKNEIDADEIARQLEVWHEWMESGLVGPAILVNGPPSVLASRLMKIVMREMVSKNRSSTSQDFPSSMMETTR